MATAGAGLNEAMGWTKVTVNSPWADQLGKALTTNLSQAVVGSALGQGELKDKLKGALAGAVLSTVGANLADWVGEHTGAEQALDRFSNKLAHGQI